MARVGVGVTFSIRLVVALFLVLTYTVIVFSFSPGLAACAAGLGAAAPLALRREGQKSAAWGKRLSLLNEAVQKRVEEGLSALKLLKIQSNETEYLRDMDDTRAGQRAQMLGFTKLTAHMTLIYQLATVVTVVVLVYFGVRVFSLEVPVLLVLVLAFGRLAPQLRQIQTFINHIMHATAALDQLKVVMSEAQSAQELQIEDKQPTPEFASEITFAKVTYTYSTRQAEALCDVTFKIPHNSITAILGASGSGKSTIADMLMGLLTPNSGAMAIDGVALSPAMRMAWRREVAYVPQDDTLFWDSIRNNLLLGNNDATEADLERVLERAAATFVHSLPQRLDTVVGDGGRYLSGGERQRISFARALLQRPKLLILDEATNALDASNEALILDTIAALRKELTVVLIAHHASGCDIAEHFVVMDNGKVAIEGNWATVSEQTRKYQVS